MTTIIIAVSTWFLINAATNQTIAAFDNDEGRANCERIAAAVIIPKLACVQSIQ